MYQGQGAGARAITAQDCTAVERADDDDDGGGGGDGDGGGTNPGGGADPNPNCTENPEDIRCDPCEVNPKGPGCGTGEVTFCEGEVDPETQECVEVAFSRRPGGSTTGTATVTKEVVSSTENYTLTLSSTSTVRLWLTGLTMDFDCKVAVGSAGGGSPPPSAANGGSATCTNRGGSRDDSWSGTLKAGSYTVTVYPYVKGSGNYTLTVSATYTPATKAPEPQPPAARTLPFTVSETSVSGDQTYDFRLTASTSVSVSLTGMNRDIDCRVGSSACTNRGGTQNDSWSGTLGAGTHSVTVYPYGGGSGSYTLKVTGTGTATTPPAPPRARPSAPRLTGAVAGRTHRLSWTEPTGGGITRYQLQTRASAAHAWRFTDAGSPSPSSSLGPGVKAWSVVTPWTLVRRYRVRARNAVGDGAWSNVVGLTTPSAPVPLTMPEIPDFPGLPSAGVVNTPFPSASGGTAPYTYTLTGLPPGISFAASTRLASGTLPTVRTATTYRITYSATDRTGRSGSVTFTATVVP